MSGQLAVLCHEARESFQRALSGRAVESAFAIALNELPGSLDAARKQSHDTVIQNAGVDRLGGVHWTYWPVATAAEDVADIGIEKLPHELLALMVLFPAGVVVIASVAVRP